MTGGSAARLAAVLGAGLYLASCSPPTFHIPPPVPPPLGEHVVAAPLEETWAAALRALAALELTVTDTNPERRTIVTDFHPLEGNSKELRASGIARFAVERDTYSAGRERLLVSLTPAGAGRTRVTITAVVQAKVERPGEIQYAKAGPETSAQSEAPGSDWEPLASNGVLEDEFLAALAAELSHTSALEQ